jgi:hypothetical protein
MNKIFYAGQPTPEEEREAWEAYIQELEKEAHEGGDLYENNLCSI